MDPIIIALLFVIGLNLLIFPIAYRLQTDKLTDVTYGMSFLGLLLFSLWMREGEIHIPVIIMSILIALWSIRIAWFLLSRVIQMGRDRRFDQIRTNPKRFFRFFLLQGFASWVIGLPFIWYILDRGKTPDYTIVEIIGWEVAGIGLLIETVADQQKMKYKSTAHNADQLYTGGLYQYVRYPNYLGEIMFWIGIALASSVIWQGWQWVAVISPIFITLLLVRVSGIPIIERSRAKRHGQDPAYIKYQKETALLIPGVY